MGDDYLTLDVGEQGDILRTVAAASGRTAVILEKDIWLCWVLQVIFSIPDSHPMAFKGGTSLSKVYGVIDRFSEDVDITLDYRAFDDTFDPFGEDTSRNQVRRFAQGLREHVERYVCDVVAPELAAAAERSGVAGRNAVRIGNDGETLRFAYPSAVEAQDYVRSDILLEFGGRNVIDPNEQCEIAPDIEALTEGLNYPRATVTVLSAERTFWEKATLAHVECHRRRLASSPDRLSRHWFDLACFAGHDVGQAALVNRRLLEDVVRHKRVFFHAGYANYDHCLDGRLRLVPDGDQVGGLRSDYEAMRNGGMLGDRAMEFDELMERIGRLEADANRGC